MATVRMWRGPNASISLAEKCAWPSKYMPNRESLVWTTMMSRPATSTSRVFRMANSPSGMITPSISRRPRLLFCRTARNSSISVPPTSSQNRRVKGVSRLLIDLQYVSLLKEPGTQHPVATRDKTLGPEHRRSFHVRYPA